MIEIQPKQSKAENTDTGVSSVVDFVIYERSKNEEK